MTEPTGFHDHPHAHPEVEERLIAIRTDVVDAVRAELAAAQTAQSAEVAADVAAVEAEVSAEEAFDARAAVAQMAEQMAALQAQLAEMQTPAPVVVADVPMGDAGGEEHDHMDPPPAEHKPRGKKKGGLSWFDE